VPRVARFILGILAFMLLVGPARAAYDFHDSGWEGTSELLELAREELGRERVELVASLDFSELKPSDGVLILYPEVELDYPRFQAFLSAGGRLALLDDHGTGARLLARFQIQRVQAPLRPAETLRSNARLAIARPVVHRVEGSDVGRHRIAADVDLVVTNHPTTLVHGDLTKILVLPAVNDPEATLAVVGVVARGRLFAMSDPSAFINLMLRYPGNRALVRGVVRYLLEPVPEERGDAAGRLFLLSKNIRQVGDNRTGDERWGDRLDELSREARALMARTHSHGLPEPLAQTLAVLVSLAILLWTALVAGRVYRRVAPRYAMTTSPTHQGGVAGRAAVLAAPTTHRALALLELKSALAEQLAHRLGLPRHASDRALLEEIDRQRALSRRSSEALRALLAEFSDIETKMVAAKPLLIRVRKVEKVRAEVFRLLAEVDERL
jgi:hypothetical protein